MKWTNELKDQLTKLAFEEKSNKEISELMGISVDKIRDSRSRFGLTVEKIETQIYGEEVRSKEIIEEEIMRLKEVRFNTYKRIAKLDEMLKILEDEKKTY